MKKIILTIATPEIRAVAEPFLANQAAYAARNNYEYRVEETIPWKDKHPSFSKVYFINAALREGFDYVLWSDADIAFTNFTVDLTDIIASRLAARPELFMTGYQQANWTKWKYICHGLTCWRPTPDALAFMDEWIDRCHRGCPAWVPGVRTPIIGHPYEQWHGDQITRDTGFHGIYAATAEEIGCFSEIWNDGKRWEVGFPTCHFAATKDWELRARVFKQKYEPLIIRN